MDECAHNGKDCAYRQNIVEVSYYIVCIVKNDVKGRVGQNDAG